MPQFVEPRGNLPWPSPHRQDVAVSSYRFLRHKSNSNLLGHHIITCGSVLNRLYAQMANRCTFALRRVSFRVPCRRIPTLRQLFQPDVYVECVNTLLLSSSPKRAQQLSESLKDVYPIKVRNMNYKTRMMSSCILLFGSRFLPWTTVTSWNLLGGYVQSLNSIAIPSCAVVIMSLVLSLLWEKYWRWNVLCGF